MSKQNHHQQQKANRKNNNENAYIFDNTLKHCLGEISRTDWEWAIDMAGGNISEAAADIGLKDIPKNAKALWGKSSTHALNQYQQWQNRKAKKNK